MTIAFYARVSSDEQRERQTIQTQLEYARSRAALEGWMLREFTDDGVSGTVPLAQRPGGRALLAAARAGDFDVVATFRLDRLGRTQRVVLDAIDQLKAAGARYRSLTEPFEVGTPFGDAALGMTSVFAQLERDSIAQRTKEGRRRVAREPNRYLGGQTPYGYRAEGKYLVVDERQADVVREIFRLYVEDDLAIDRIADLLNARGEPTKRPGRWHGSAVGAILRDPLYTGQAMFLGLPREVPQVIAHATLARARERAASHRQWRRSHGRRDYALRGLLRCECGVLLTGFTYYLKRDHSTWRQAYRCSHEHRLPSPHPVVKEDEAIAAMWSDVERFFASPDELLRRIVAGDTRPQERRAEEELVELAGRLRDLDAREQRLLDAHLGTMFSPAALEAKSAELGRERQAIEGRMQEVRSARSAAARAVQETKTLRARLLELAMRARMADPAKRAAVLRELVRSTRVEYTGLHRARLTVRWAFAPAAVRVSSDVHDESASGTWLETVHELGRAA